MSSNFDCSSSSGRTTSSPSGNQMSSGVDGTPKRKVRKPVVKVLKDDEEQPARPEKEKKPASASKTTKPAFKPEDGEDARPAKKSRQPRKEDLGTSSEEAGPSSPTTTSHRRDQAGTPVSGPAPGSVSSPRSDRLGRAMLAIERGNLVELQQLAPKHVPVDSISSQGRSLLAIAKFHQQPDIVDYLMQQLTGRAIKAIELADVEALKKLVPAQVEKDAVSTNGRSLLEIARYRQRQLAAIVNYLESVNDEEDEPLSVRKAGAPGAITGASSKKVRVIEFYDKDSEYYEFTNFYQGKPIRIDGAAWKTAEHYFQAQKFVGGSLALQKKVQKQESARDALDFARAHKEDWRTDWQQVKVSVMRLALAAKFSQDKALRESLCGTGNAQLVEASPKDAFWGYGPDGKGENMLGKLLMELRAELQAGMYL